MGRWGGRGNCEVIGGRRWEEVGGGGWEERRGVGEGRREPVRRSGEGVLEGGLEVISRCVFGDLEVVWKVVGG